jgi:outer membrane lipoprotein-sorting protein
MDEMDNAGTTIWVDSTTGRILKMLTTDQSLIEPTTENEMSRLWGKKLTD